LACAAEKMRLSGGDLISKTQFLGLNVKEDLSVGSFDK